MDAYKKALKDSKWIPSSKSYSSVSKIINILNLKMIK